MLVTKKEEIYKTQKKIQIKNPQKIIKTLHQKVFTTSSGGGGLQVTHLLLIYTARFRVFYRHFDVHKYYTKVALNFSNEGTVENITSQNSRATNQNTLKFQRPKKLPITRFATKYRINEGRSFRSFDYTQLNNSIRYGGTIK